MGGTSGGVTPRFRVDPAPRRIVNVGFAVSLVPALTRLDRRVALACVARSTPFRFTARFRCKLLLCLLFRATFLGFDIGSFMQESRMENTARSGASRFADFGRRLSVA